MKQGGNEEGARDGAPSQKSRLVATGMTYNDEAAESIAKRPRPGSQRAIILQILKDKEGDWEGVDVLMRAANSAAVHSQVAALRQTYGFNIKNKLERAKNGVVLSYYRLVLPELKSS